MSAVTDAAIHRARAVLERASDSWRNGSPSDEGPLHWPVAIQVAERELRTALETLKRLHERVVQLEAIARINAETIRGMQQVREWSFT